MNLPVPCAPRAFWTGLTLRLYWKAERAVRWKTREKLDIVGVKSAGAGNETRRMAERRLGRWIECMGHHKSPKALAALGKVSQARRSFIAVDDICCGEDEPLLAYANWDIVVTLYRTLSAPSASSLRVCPPVLRPSTRCGYPRFLSAIER
jgi:hypothetical protein